jgi:uncharacterized protein involved in outer membrane biogenesis
VEPTLPPEPEKRTGLFKRFLIFLLAAALLVPAGSALMLYLYEDEVKAAMIKELNKHLKAEVKIQPQDINLTILSSFPDASLEFSNLLVMEALPSKLRDTLLFARKVNLHFDLAGLWRGKYSIEKLTVENGIARLRVLKSGQNNFTVWEGSGETSGSKMNFDLNHVRVSDLNLTYSDEKNRYLLVTKIAELSLAGNFGSGAYALESSANLMMQSLTHENRNLLREKNLNYELQLAVNNTAYQITRGNVTINEAGFSVTGAFAYDSTLHDLGLAFRGEKLNLSSIRSLLAENVKEKLGEYDFDGHTGIEGTITYQKAGELTINGAFIVNDGNIIYRPGLTRLSNLKAEGELKYTNSHQKLELKSVSFDIEGGPVTGSLVVTKFDDPQLSLKVNSDLDLERLLQFYPIDTVEQVSGRLAMSLTLDGPIKAIREKESGKINAELTAHVKDLQLRFKHDRKTFGVPECEFSMDGKDAQVRKLRLTRGNSDFTMEGKVEGLVKYLTNSNEQISLEGNLYSQRIEAGDFISDNESAKSSGSNNRIIPSNVNLSLRLKVHTFTFGKFVATEISGDADIRRSKLMLGDIDFQTMGGSVNVNALADNSGNGIALNLECNLTRINIKELFRQMNNFGQATLHEDHLKGTATATIDFSGKWDNALVADERSLLASCNLLVEGGELNNFAPLTGLSRFLKIADLGRVRFSTLRSKVNIANRLISISDTRLENSVVNLDFNGTHTFDNYVDYHFRMLYRDVKAKRKEKVSEFGEEIDPDNRRMLFITAIGSIDNPTFSYDGEGLRKKIRNDLRQEKQNVKQILREEFSVFRKDTTKIRKPQDPAVFNFEQQEKPAKKTLEVKKRAEEDEDF